MRPLIIYLDQSRVSEMTKVHLDSSPDAGGTHRDAYRSLYKRLRTLVESGIILCPFSLWHALESVQFDDDTVRRGVCDFFDWASKGRSFRFFLDTFDAELASLAGYRPMEPLGVFLDCFPSTSVSQLTRDALEGATQPFTIIVDMLREDGSLRASAIQHRNDMLNALQGYITQYHGTADSAKRAPKPSIASIREELGSDFLRTHLRSLVGRGLELPQAQRIHAHAMQAIRDGSWANSGIPHLGAWVNVFAARVHNGGKADATPKRRGEAFDLCHMAALATSDMFMMERKFTSLSETAARSTDTKLIHSPADLLTLLEHL